MGVLPAGREVTVQVWLWTKAWYSASMAAHRLGHKEASAKVEGSVVEEIERAKAW